MSHQGWKRLLAGFPWFRGPGRFPVTAYSEFMPPPRFGRKPYGSAGGLRFDADDPLGWPVSEYEEAFELTPGLRHLATHLVRSLEHLGHGREAHQIARGKLQGNPYWPDELAARAGSLEHERYVTLAPLALSRTQDDKGRVRWTLFGGSEQGPERGFWRGFFTAPGQERPKEQALDFFRRLLSAAYGEPLQRLGDLRRAGFRILSHEAETPSPYWREGHDALPSWTAPYLLPEGGRLSGVKYLLTFRPFGSLPPAVRRAYLGGDLHLLPFPGSLVFWGTQRFLAMQRELPLAMQIPLLHSFPRHEVTQSIRVPQSGWMHEHHPDHPEPHPDYGPYRGTYRRTHRWARIHRHEDELAVADGEDKIVHVLFSTLPDDVGLYGKPMARNAQIWTHDFRLLLDGPRASREQLAHAAATLRGGGTFGYRFLFPAMRLGRHEVYWQRPLVAYLSPQTGEPEVLPDAPLGYMTAYRADRPDVSNPVELWPRLLRRDAHMAAVRGFAAGPEHHEHRIARTNVRKLLDAYELLGDRPLPRSFARALLTLPKEERLDDWLGRLESAANDPAAGRELAETLRDVVRDRALYPFFAPLTYHRTARRSFETAYWKTIARLATGRYINKDNADCALDPVSRAAQKHHHRDLEALGDYLLAYYQRVLAKSAAGNKATCGDLPFHWQTDFDYPWAGGWLENQEGNTEERNLLTIIPGRDRGRAVIMADHYDTAYMEDCYEKARGGNGARLAAAGADDNHSATAALMLGAPAFLELSRAGLLGCDVWLVHLTGEEFPSDCMGARHLAQSLVEGTLGLRRAGRRRLDLSGVRVEGVYVLDMIAHNREHEQDRDIFQISPGAGAGSLRLAQIAHEANVVWNAGTAAWNNRAERRGCRRGRRSADGATLPAVAQHPQLHGEIRPPADPRSSLYNTDGQIFSDAGVPVVLFMENYDINRVGYHDTHDTLANIDLDYGAAVAAIAIESVARATHISSATSPRRDNA